MFAKVRSLFSGIDKEVCKKIVKIDVIIALIITVLYAFVGFWHLGDRQMPQTVWHPKQGDSVVLYSERSSDQLWYHCGLIPDDDYYRSVIGVNLKVETSDDGVVWSVSETVDDMSIWQWKSYTLVHPGKYIKLTALDDNTVISEVALHSTYFDSMSSFTVEGIDLLNDEQDMVPEYISYENSGYFDEVYHPRTAYEHLIGLEPYENTHPPLGKYIIGIGIAIFGLNPFGWRFMGTLFGVLMLPVLYHLIKKLFGRTWLSTLGTMLFALDFMHFTQTRLATIDTYAVFFILLMYDAMICFLNKDIVDDKLSKLLIPLGISGLFFGIGSASKWTVIYGGAGLAVLFFSKLIITIHSYKVDKVMKAKAWKRSFVLCLWCLLLFIVIPVSVYFIAYLPMTLLSHNKDNMLWAFWNYQTNMFNYHSQLVAEHPYESPWYEWPVIIKPIFYSANTVQDGLSSNIACLGNPVIWWIGLLALVVMLILWIRHPKLKQGIILCGYASVYVPWMLVSRCTFIYHYFTAVPFIILALVWVADVLKYRTKVGSLCTSTGKCIPVIETVVCLFVLTALVFFIVYFPIMSGKAVSGDYLSALKLLDTWYW